MDGFVRIGTELDSKQFEKELRALEKAIDKKRDLEVEVEISKDKLKQAKAEIKAQLDDIEQELKDFDKEVKNALYTSASFRGIRLDTKKMTDEDWIKVGEMLPETIESLQPKYDGIISRQTQLLNKEKELTTEHDKKVQKLNNANKEVDRMNKKLDTAKDKAKQVRLDNINKSINKVKSGMEGILKKVARWGMAIFGIRSAYLGVRRAMSVLTQYNKQLAVDLEYITFGLAKVLEGAILKLVNLVYTALAYVNYIARAWFGITDLFKKSSVKEFQKGKEAMGGMARFCKRYEKRTTKNAI